MGHTATPPAHTALSKAVIYGRAVGNRPSTSVQYLYSFPITNTFR